MYSFTALTTLLLSVIGTSLASSSSSNTVESIRAVPKGWREIGEPSPANRIHFRVALDMPRHEFFEQKLMAVSTPDHPEYGQHLSREELKEILKPKDESTQAVLSWLQSSGVSNCDIRDNGEWINFWASIEKAEEILETKFYVYGNQISKTEITRTLHYSVPQNVSSHITMIQPTTRFGEPRAQRRSIFEITDGPIADGIAKVPAVPSTNLNGTACNATISPDCIRALYNISDYQSIPSNNSLFGVCGYLKEYAKYDALEMFLPTYAPYAVGANFSYVLVNGGLNNQSDTVDDDGEANLDIQYAVPIAFNQTINYYSTGGLGEIDPDLDQPTGDSNEPYLDFLTYILDVPDNELPQTISTSYGEDEQSIPEAYANSVCSMFGQLGARGVSVVFSSGDTGVGSACQLNDGSNKTAFLPIFPAACPWVTSVGATRYVQPEAAASFSSGGFSNRWARPDYQSSAVSAYLNILGDQWSGLYNASGRGFPDVSAQGVKFHVIDQGKDTQVSGTSASAPTFAAIISLLNNARLSAGQAPLGFLNPWLYSTAQSGGGLTDIVNGGSRGCKGTDIYTGGKTHFVPYASWNATTGWDPVSGLGTPNFGMLLELLGLHQNATIGSSTSSGRETSKYTRGME